MVRICFSSSLGPSVELASEFWRIRDLIVETAKGVRGKQKETLNDRVKGRSSSPDTNYRDSDESSFESSDPSPEGFSLESDGSDEGNRHFMVVFFDMLYVDGRSLLQEPYSTRRALLKDTIREIEGFVSVLSFIRPRVDNRMKSTLASRTPIDMSGANTEQKLQGILATSSSRFEGVI